MGGRKCRPGQAAPVFRFGGVICSWVEADLGSKPVAGAANLFRRRAEGADGQNACQK